MRLRFIVLVVLLLIVSVPLSAQALTPITIALPGLFDDTFTTELVADFEAENPGYTLQLVDSGLTFAFSPPNDDLEGYFESVGAYVSQADAVLVTASGYFVTPEATGAGYYLNLEPLVADDPTMNEDDFFAPVWDSFQWDRGIWAVPFSADIYIITYDTAAFDAAGLTYPDETWTLADYDTAIRTLTQKDENGVLVTPGISAQGDVVRAMLFHALMDDGTVLDEFDSPYFTSPDVVELLTVWNALIQEGYIGLGENPAPIQITSLFSLLQLTAEEQTRAIAMLPGGLVGMDVQGFAVSAGTRHPEAAYAAVRFLSQRPEVGTLLGGTPARQSLVGAQTEDPTGIQSILQLLPPEAQALLRDGLVNGIPTSDLRFTYYLTPLFNGLLEPGADIPSTLRELEVTALEAVQTAQERRAENVITVAEPEAEQSAEGLVLKFGYTSFVQPLPNQDDWDALVADFVASDPDVDGIDFEVGFNAFALEDAAAAYDCFYLPFNAVPGADLSPILNLDPYLSSDASYDPDDVIASALAQVQRDGRTWAMPIALEPSILEYNPQAFSDAGLDGPQPGWTVDEFVDALRQLNIDPEGDAPLDIAGQGGNALLTLMAAYGGLPLDYRGEALALNFTDAASVDAIRAVLDLAKDGLISYDAELGSLQNAFTGGIGGGAPTAPLTVAALSLFSFGAPPEGEAVYLPTTFPVGSQYAALSYTISAAYISAQSQNADACYRWISTFASDPTLFPSMPARLSQIPQVEQSQSPQAVALYNEVARQADDPNTVSLPSLFDGSGNVTGFLYQLWLFQAFDAYVLEEADLVAALTDAQTTASDFQTCMADAPELVPGNFDANREFVLAFADCGRTVDPSLAPIMGIIEAQANQ